MNPLRKVGIWALVSVGLLQSIGYVFGIPGLRGLGLAFVASPLPLVFSHFRGLETFSSQFEVKLQAQNGEVFKTQLGPKNYARLGGPYNRRNVYGAVAAFGPKLTEGNEPQVVQSVLKYGFCDGPLLKTLGFSEKVKTAQIQVRNSAGRIPSESTLEVECQP